jgi:hypothetical protein
MRAQNPRFFLSGGESGAAGSLACAAGEDADAGAGVAAVPSGRASGAGATADARVSGARLRNVWYGQ